MTSSPRSRTLFGCVPCLVGLWLAACSGDAASADGIALGDAGATGDANVLADAAAEPADTTATADVATADTTDDADVALACIPSTVCDDGNACTVDTCEPTTGACTHTKVGNGTACDADGSDCTQDDACKNGACTAGKPKNCDDGNVCTLDACGATGCTHAPLPDGLACSGGYCAAGACFTCPDGYVRIALDDAGVAKAVCAADAPVWGIEADTPAQLTDNGDGTIGDALTGLTWKQTVDTGVKEDDSPAFCDKLVFAGKSDWRLPTVTELLSLMDYAATNAPLINQELFPKIPSSYTWTWNEDGKQYERLYVDFSKGEMAAWPYDAGAVRCVRGATTNAPPLKTRFTVSASKAIVTDNATGLQWQRTPSKLQYALVDAQTYCAGLTLDGVTGWKVPGIRALFGITDRSDFTVAAVDLSIFPNTANDWFWSSTPLGFGDAATDAFSVNFGVPNWNVAYGNIAHVAPDGAQHVRCVHEGVLAP